MTNFPSQIAIKERIANETSFKEAESFTMYPIAETDDLIYSTVFHYFMTSPAPANEDLDIAFILSSGYGIPEGKYKIEISICNGDEFLEFEIDEPLDEESALELFKTYGPLSN
jgi:hypothetical protein